MNVTPFLPKQDHRLPNYYGIKLYYVDGTVEEFEIASHRLGEKVLEFVTNEDLWHWVQMTSIRRIAFDKQFSKMITIKAELMENAEAAKKVQVVQDINAIKESRS